MTIADIATKTGLSHVTVLSHVKKKKLRAEKDGANRYVITDYDAAVYLAARFFDSLR